MQKSKREYSTYNTSLRAAIDWLATTMESHAKRTIIVRSYAQTLSAKRVLSTMPDTLGINVATLDSWLTDVWELNGNGRRLVTADQRSMLLLATYSSEADASSAVPSAGYLHIAQRVAREALPFTCKTEGLEPAQIAFCNHLQRYAQALSERGLCETSEAYEYLFNASETLSSQAIALVDILSDDITYLQDQLLCAIETVNFTTDRIKKPGDCTFDSFDGNNTASELVDLQNLLFCADGSNPISPQDHVRFVLCTGLDAESQALFDALQRCANEGSKSIAIACKQPLQLYEALYGRMRDNGFDCSARGSVAFARTSVGRAFLTLHDLFAQEQPDIFQAADYTLDPLSGMNRKMAFASAKEWRENRLVETEDILGNLDLRAWNDEIQGLTSIFENEGPLSWLDAITPLIQNIKEFSAAAKAREFSTIEALRGTLQASQAYDVPLDALVPLMRATTIPCGFHLIGENACVTIDTLDALGACNANSFDTVILAQQNSRDYPIAPSNDAVTLLYEIWDILQPQQPLKQAHRSFFGAVAAARTTVVIERCLHDEKADDLYPSALFEETIDCYRTDLTSDEDFNKDLKLPTVLNDVATCAGEEELFLDATGSSVQETADAPAAVVGSITNTMHDFIGPNDDTDSIAGFRLSPSQIESYLECPYQWFAKRRLRLGSPDEGFTNMEKGTFVHEVLQCFINAWMERHPGKALTNDDLAEARTLLEETFHEVETAQITHDCGKRYVALTSWEHSQRRDILKQLTAYLDDEARLLPGFHPLHTEWKYDLKASDLNNYASNAITGSVDRIDVDDNGNAVVIDYKSSLSDDYRLYPAKETDGAFELPRKMQALVYAQVVRKELGLNVVAALYVNPLTPNSKNRIKGAYDPGVLKEDDLLGIDRASYGLKAEHGPSFDVLLDTTERMVEQRLALLAQGEIEPHPISTSACEWCPVRVCPERLV